MAIVVNIDVLPVSKPQRNYVSPVGGSVCMLSFLCDKEQRKSIEKGSWFLMAVLMLLGISNFLTGNLWIIWLNYLVMFVLLVGILLHNFYEVMLCFGFFSSYCGVRYIGLHSRKETVEQKKTAEPLLAIALLGTVLTVYLLFCGIQVFYLFLGAGTLPKGVTYADYARTGFFQLLFICLFNIAAVLVIKKYFRENKALNACLLAVCGCTFIMTASSAYRMLLYIGAYYLTVLRFFVLAALFAIAVVMAGVTIFILKKEFPLVKFTVAVLCIIYTGLSFSRMDYWIADYNLNHYSGRTEAIDYDYIACLSTDAAPVVAEYGKTHPEIQEEDRWYYQYWTVNRGAMEQQSLRKFNVSHNRAAELLEEL